MLFLCILFLAENALRFYSPNSSFMFFKNFNLLFPFSAQEILIIVRIICQAQQVMDLNKVYIVYIHIYGLKIYGLNSTKRVKNFISENATVEWWMTESKNILLCRLAHLLKDTQGVTAALCNWIHTCTFIFYDFYFCLCSDTFSVASKSFPTLTYLTCFYMVLSEGPKPRVHKR